MIGEIKNILNKIINNPDKFNFETYSNIFIKYDKGPEKIRHAVICRFENNIYYSIDPSTIDNSIHIRNNTGTIKTIKCSDEDYLDIVSLTEKVDKIYKDRAYNEFIHYFD